MTLPFSAVNALNTTETDTSSAGDQSWQWLGLDCVGGC